MALLESEPKQVAQMAVAALRDAPAYLFAGAGAGGTFEFAEHYIGTPSVLEPGWHTDSDLCAGSFFGALGACLGFGCATVLSGLLKDCCLMQCPSSKLSAYCYSDHTRTDYTHRNQSTAFWERIKPIFVDAFQKSIGMAAAMSIWLPVRTLLISLTAHLTKTFALVITSAATGLAAGLAFLCVMIAIKYYSNKATRESTFDTNSWFKLFKQSLLNILGAIVAYTLFTQLPTFNALHGVTLWLGQMISFAGGHVASTFVELPIKAMLVHLGLWNPTTGWTLKKSSGHQIQSSGLHDCCAGCWLPCLKCLGPGEWTKSLRREGSTASLPTERTPLRPGKATTSFRRDVVSQQPV